MTQQKVSNLNVPNVLTVIRILFVPLFAWVLLAQPHNPQWRIWATIIFAVAIATDFADGKIARKYNLVTTFGKLADPIADKALTGMAFIGLSIIGELWWWVTIIILVREWGITALRFQIKKYGVMAANKGGKAKTAMQSLALVLMLLPITGAWRWPGWICMGIAFILTIVTGFVYLKEAAGMRQRYIAEHGQGA
ncbi:MAG: CDP-diacylglycerol--glycerol-3-phosphate 3-phosphatidyltransferase [Propionibacteriaceae bacterium]